MTEDSQQEQPKKPEADLLPLEPTMPTNIVELNRRNVVLRKMHVPGTKSIANGVRLDLEHLFGLPNVPRNPYMVFYSDEDRPKGKAGMIPF